MTATTILRMGVPSGRRIEPAALSFLEGCGLRVRKESERQLSAGISGLPGVVVFMQRARDIVTQVTDGDLDIGLTGVDFVEEFGTEGDDLVMLDSNLGFSSGDLVVAVPDGWIDVTSLVDLADVAIALRERGQLLRVASSYPRLAQRFLFEKGITHFTIVAMDGGVEAAPGAGFADVIVELTVSGVSLKENRLKVLRHAVVLQTQACLIGNRRALATTAAKRELTRRILELIEARGRAQEYFSVTANLSAETEAAVATRLHASPVTRGQTGPTVARVYRPSETTTSEHWFAATIIVRSQDLQPAIDHLRSVGGSGISVLQVRYLFDEHSHRFNALVETLGTDTSRSL